MYNYGIVADETGISGWNPALWIILLAGMLVALTGAIMFVHSLSSREIPTPSQ